MYNKRPSNMPSAMSVRNRMAMLNKKPTYNKPTLNIPSNLRKLTNRKMNYAISACKNKVGPNYTKCVKNITGNVKNPRNMNVKKPLNGIVNNRKRMLANQACKYSVNKTKCIQNFLVKPNYPVRVVPKVKQTPAKRFNVNSALRNAQRGRLGLKRRSF